MHVNVIGHMLTFTNVEKRKTGSTGVTGILKLLRFTALQCNTKNEITKCGFVTQKGVNPLISEIEHVEMKYGWYHLSFFNRGEGNMETISGSQYLQVISKTADYFLTFSLIALPPSVSNQPIWETKHSYLTKFMLLNKTHTKLQKLKEGRFWVFS